MKDKGIKQSAQPSRPVRQRQVPRGGTTPMSRTGAPVRAAAGEKAVRPRVAGPRY